MAVRRGELWKKGEGFATQIAKASADLNPIMIFIVRLFTATTMTDDRIAQTIRASA